MKVFYHNDNDGKCSAHLIDRYYNLDPPDHASQLLIKFYPMEYGKPFPFDEIIEDEKVYILDYSIEPNEMLSLFDITGDVIWIDHHKTAIDKYDEMITELNKGGLIIEGLRDIKFAGCENTWHFLYGYKKDIPLYIQLIGERDTWRNPDSPFVRAFHYALGAHENNPIAEIWQIAMKDMDRLIKEGNVIYNYVTRQNIDALEKRGFWFDFHGYKTYAINSDMVRSSEFYPKVAPEAEIWMMFRFIPKDKNGADGYWSISLYSDRIDVSDIAKQYEFNGKRGGGHKGASGFQSKGLDFLYDKE